MVIKVEKLDRSLNRIGLGVFLWGLFLLFELLRSSFSCLFIKIEIFSSIYNLVTVES